MHMTTAEQADCEYIVVGSGAGGGTLAARLAEAGKSVILLEAGGDPRRLCGTHPGSPDAVTLPDDYDVPAFHPLASENDALKWDFFVRHYGNDEQQRRDPKHREFADGPRGPRVLYPRAGTLGGCTAHNAMILVYPHNADWDGIAELTGDASWSADNMRRYFRSLENCRYRPGWRLLGKLGPNPGRHGWNGWLHTEVAIPRAALADKRLTETIAGSALTAFKDLGKPIEQLEGLSESGVDPNDWRRVRANAEGLFCMPLTTRDHQRTGARERVIEVANAHPDRLKVVLNALATRVVFDAHHRAIGVEYLSGANLYRAHARPSEGDGERRQIRASREVILAGGAFNTPQLLMLSGIGPRAVLDRHRITVRVDLPGVGQNLQDRYEVGIVNRMSHEWAILAGARFAEGDLQYRQWTDDRDGMYATNGGALAVIKRSVPARALPDLFCMAVLAKFKGYFPGYSRLITEHHDYLTWTVLKAHTVNRAGEVTLRTGDPRDPPEVNFKYFEEGNDTTDEDLESVVEGIRFVRRLTKPLKDQHLIAEEELPGERLQSTDELKEFVRANAWGHHASCSCAIGPRNKAGVLTADFRVHGTHGLRVVDASAFPRIPGFFIASAVYMVGEKAADVILTQAAPT
jgi:choline dehydrogenase-like flavoprotein